LTKLGDADIVRKIISVLPHSKYASIITILHNMEDLSTMTSALVIGKLVAFEMSQNMGQEEAASSSKSIALTCDEHKKMKGRSKLQVQAQAPQVKMKMRMTMMKKVMIKPPPPLILMKKPYN
jgi:ABC-type multidrug transport system ATPase subunit